MSRECFLLSSLPLGTPATLEGDTVTDGAGHRSTFPSALLVAGQSCAPRDTMLALLLPARQCHPNIPELLGPSIPAVGGGPFFSSISGAEGPPG